MRPLIPTIWVWPLPNSLVSIIEDIHSLHCPSVQTIVTLSPQGRSIKVGSIPPAEQEKVATFPFLVYTKSGVSNVAYDSIQVINGSSDLDIYTAQCQIVSFIQLAMIYLTNRLALLTKVENRVGGRKIIGASVSLSPDLSITSTCPSPLDPPVYSPECPWFDNCIRVGMRAPREIQCCPN